MIITSPYDNFCPHRYGEAGSKLLFTQVAVSPVGDELLLDFSKALVSNEQLGQDGIPDYLSISFSAVDAVNHFFGPSSLENEVVVRRLDATLADLFKFIDQTVGLKHTLIVLSGDHGMADMPEYMTELGYAAGRLVPEEIVATANQAGQKLGIDEIVRFFYRPYIYLNDEKIAAAKLDPVKVEQAVADSLTDFDGINLAVSTRSLATEKSNQLIEQVRNNQHVTRSGDIYIIQGDHFKAIHPQKRFDFIISNPPYIPHSHIAELHNEVKNWEPNLALNGGEQGTDFYEILKQSSLDLLKPNGYLVFEHGFDQQQTIHDLIVTEPSLKLLNKVKDYGDIDRVLSFQKIK